MEAETPLAQQDTEPNQWTLEGGLIAHSAGNWYVFDEDRSLKAIPEDESRRMVAGEFYIAYQQISEGGQAVGYQVSEDQMKNGLPYSPVESCTDSPGSTVVYRFDN